MKKKRLLILGGLSQQNEIIKDAQKNGCHVIVVDYLTDSPGKKIADESYLISITDVDAIVNLCKEKGIDGVMNYCIDPGQKPYQQICEKLGLPCYGTKQQFDILTNKDLFKESCVKYGVGVIQGKTISETFNETDLTDIVYPVIVKPSDGRASKGISKCNNFSELQNAITYALSFSERKTVNIEKFTKKPELCAKYFVCDGEIYLTALSDTHTHFENGNRVYICGKTYPSRYLQEFKETADIKLRDMIRGLNIKNGPLSFTGFFDDGIFRFFDPSFRMGGGQEWTIIENITGVDISKCLTNFAITGSMGNITELRKLDYGFAKKHAAALQLLIKPGKIKEVIGIDEVLKLGSVVGYHISHKAGDIIKNIGTSENVFMRILLVGNSKEELIDDQLYIERTLKVYDENNENLILSTVENRYNS